MPSNEEEFLPGAVTCLPQPTRAIQTLPRRGESQWAHIEIGVLDNQQNENERMRFLKFSIENVAMEREGASYQAHEK